MKKVNIDPSEHKPNKINLLSTFIDDNYIILSTTETTTPDNKNIKKKLYQR